MCENGIYQSGISSVDVLSATTIAAMTESMQAKEASNVPMELDDPAHQDAVSTEAASKKSKGSHAKAVLQKATSLPDCLKSYQSRFEGLRYGDEWDHLVKGWLEWRKLWFP